MDDPPANPAATRLPKGNGLTRRAIGLLGAAMLAAGGLLAGGQAGAGPVDTAIVFVIDNSSSMSDPELEIAREAHAQAIQSPDVLDAISRGPMGRSAFALVDFARVARMSIDWTIVDGPDAARAFAAGIRQLERLRGATGIGRGLALSQSLLERVPWDSSRRVVNVIGDGGENVDRALLRRTRQRLIEDGVIINGMPIMIAPDISDIGEFDDLDAYFAAMVIGGPGAFSVPLTRIDEMPVKLRQKLVMELF